MIKPHSFLIETRNTSWVFEIGATATPLKARATNGSVGGSDVEAKAEVER